MKKHVNTTFIHEFFVHDTYVHTLVVMYLWHIYISIYNELCLMQLV
jgi:hypothetical protein